MVRSVLTVKLLEPMIRLSAIKAHELCEGVLCVLCAVTPKCYLFPPASSACCM
jgi:hypothetical protein